MSIEKRQHVHGMWAAVAAKWEEHADYVETRAGALNAALLEGAALRRTDRVLELACGPGGFGLLAARAAGHVVLSDVVPEMVEIAAKRAADHGVLNVTTKVLDLEEIDEPDDSFDAVISREGLMFAVEPQRAFAEIRRVLRPGGRLAASVWAERDRNPWLDIVMTAVSDLLGRPMPPPGMPGPFALADADRLRALATGAGFVDVRLTRVAVPLRAASVDEWWARTRGVAGPVAGIIATLPDDRRTALEGDIRTAAEAYVTADGIEFPGEALVLTAYGSEHDDD
jgi:SAM-dependent methyltransferase